MATKVGEMFISLAVDAASGNLSVHQLVGALGELDVVSLGSVGILSKVTSALMGMASAATSTAVELTALHDLTGADPKIVQQWEAAAAQVVGHTGSIIKAIEAVHEMNKRIAAGGGTPAVVGTLLGMSTTKGFDKGGHAILKDAMDYMREMAKNGSQYQSLDKEQQEAALDQLFGGAGPDIFREIKAMRAGTFRPDKMHVISDQQTSELNKVNMDWIAVKQDVVGIFDRLLSGGAMVDQILVAMKSLLDGVNRLLDSPGMKKSMHRMGESAADTIHGKNNLALAGGMLFPGGVGSLLGSALDAKFNANRIGAERDKDGKLTVNLLHNGKPLKSKSFRQRELVNADFGDVVENWGNTP
ncbi:MAG: hypothetical protein V4510_10055 [bacterium]